MRDGKPTPSAGGAIRTWVDGVIESGKYSQVSYGYDSWGNQNTVTSYTGYGTAADAPTTGAATSTIVFDPIYHVYPVSQTTPPTTNVPAGLTTTSTYDYGLGVPLTETDPNGNETSAVYDAFGRMTKLIREGDDSTNATITIGYNDVDQTLAFPFTTTIAQKIDTTPRYYTVQRVYDGIGRQIQITSGGTVVDTVYQSPTVTKQSIPYIGTAPNPLPFTITTVDPAARTTTVQAPDGTSTVSTTDGLVTSVEDANGHITVSTSDLWGRVLSVVPPTGPSVSYTYDELDRLLTAERGGVMTELFYDKAGRKTSMSDPDMGDWSYDYDALGNLTRQTDAELQRICLYYDSLNRLVGKHYRSDDSCPANPTFDVSYAYDFGTNGIGRRTSMIDDSGSASWNYDSRGRVLSESKIITGAGTFDTSWEYNSADLPISMTYPDGEEVTYDYNDRMLLESLSGTMNQVTTDYVQSTTYDSAGRIDLRSLGNGTQTDYTYYPWDAPAQGGRLQTMLSGTSSDPDALQNLSYVYDPAGNIFQITDARVDEKQTFRYDSLDRLRCSGLTAISVTSGCETYNEETDTFGGLNGTDIQYTYNAVTGNLATKGGLSLGYTDPNHAHAATSAGGNSYEYDDNGNMIKRNTGSSYDLVYDAENRLVSVAPGTMGMNPPLPVGEGLGVRGEPPLSSGHLPQNGGEPEGKAHLVSYNPQPQMQSGFPSTSVLDDFDRADGAMGTNWGGAIFSTSNTALEIQAGQAAGISATYNSNYWSAGSLGPDSEVYADVPAVTADGHFFYIMLRITQPGGNASGYRLRVDKSSGTDAVIIQRVNAGSATTLATFSQEVSSGDAVGLKAVGNTLTAYYRSSGGSWAALGNTTDGTYAGAGYIGLGIFGSTGRMDNFGGGNVSGLATSTPTLTATATSTSVATSTFTATSTATLTPGANTPTSTSTPSPTSTGTPTFTPTATSTATATYTPTPPPAAAFQSASFEYDGDGRRVKSEIVTTQGTISTYFVSNYYEVTADGKITKYYYAGAQRVAMREYTIPQPSTLTYLLGDHLGSTSITTDEAGDVVSELRYTPWGEVRDTTGVTATRYQYTGQFSYANDFGLLFYNARWYDPTLGRFAQADTDVPASQGVQGLNRYAFVNNNPIRYNDPTGHMIDDGDDGGVVCTPSGDLVCQLRKANNNPDRKTHRDDKRDCNTVKCQAKQGDLFAILDLLTPTNLGWNVQGTFSAGSFLGLEGTGEFNAGVMHYRNTHELILYLDLGASGGAGAKLPPVPFSATLTTGPTAGWFSSGSNGGDFSGNLSGTLAGGPAVTASLSVPMNANVDKLPYVDPKYGETPVIAYLGGGIGCCTADVAAGASKTVIRADISFLLPGHWNK